MFTKKHFISRKVNTRNRERNERSNGIVFEGKEDEILTQILVRNVQRKKLESVAVENKGKNKRTV